nr:MAG: putative RNA dependent RNA polymerase [Yunnan mito-like virus 26]
MKIFNNSHYFYFQNLRMKSLKKIFTWHDRLKSVKSLYNSMLKVGLSVNGLVTNNTISCLGIFLVSIMKLIRKNGMTFTAKYLKSCGLFVMKAVGMRDKSSLHSCVYNDTKVALCNGGIPRIIPIYWRNGIRKGDSRVIRLVLSICNLYRVMPYKGKVKLETIYGPSNFYIRDALDNYIPRFLNLIGVFDRPFIFNFNPFTIRSAGSIVETSESLMLNRKLKYLKKYRRSSYIVPGVRSGLIVKALWYWVQWRDNSSSGILRSLRSLYLSPQLWESVRFFFVDSTLKRTWVTTNSWYYIENLAKKLAPYSYIFRGMLGKLVYLDEPGKVRVIAMVDVWTQWLLNPLHVYIFDILRNIEEDGTFDQDACVKNLQTKLATCKCAFSFDLSAATDRLPILLQVSLLNYISPKLGTMWSNLLINRDYYTPDGEPLRYAVGQPMGALSSWAMLALTHHLIVQYCANKVTGKTIWFKEYVILGDDVVITNILVAREYLKVMKELDLEINFSKSLISPKGYAEFAKRFISSSETLSGASLLEFSSLSEGFSNLISLTRRYEIPQSSFNRILGKGSKAQGHYSNIVTSKRINSNFIDSVMYNLSVYKPVSLFRHFKDYIPYWGIPKIDEYKRWISIKTSSWRILTETSPVHLAFGISSNLRVMSNLEIIKVRSLTNRMLDYQFPKWNGSYRTVVRRDLFVKVMTIFDEYFIKIFYPESDFYSDLVWGCAPKLKMTNWLKELYPNYILSLANPLEEKFSLMFNHPKVYFSDKSLQPLKSGVSHMFDRIRVLNKFKQIKGLDDMSLWLYYYCLFHSSWRNRFDTKQLTAPKPDKPLNSLPKRFSMNR